LFLDATTFVSVVFTYTCYWGHPNAYTITFYTTI